MPLTVYLIIFIIVTESVAVAWYSGAIHSKLNEKLPLSLPAVITFVKTILFAAGLFTGYLLADVSPWFSIIIAYSIMFITGLKIITENLRFAPEEKIVYTDNLKTMMLVGLAGGFNVLFIGISLGLIGVDMMGSVITFLAATPVLSLIALFAGRRTGLRPEIRYAAIAGGVIICIVAVNFFITFFLK